jgi:hypothetical protein
MCFFFSDCVFREAKTWSASTAGFSIHQILGLYDLAFHLNRSIYCGSHYPFGYFCDLLSIRSNWLGNSTGLPAAILEFS